MGRQNLADERHDVVALDHELHVDLALFVLLSSLKSTGVVECLPFLGRNRVLESCNVATQVPHERFELLQSHSILARIDQTITHRILDRPGQLIHIDILEDVDKFENLVRLEKHGLVETALASDERHAPPETPQGFDDLWRNRLQDFFRPLDVQVSDVVRKRIADHVGQLMHLVNHQTLGVELFPKQMGEEVERHGRKDDAAFLRLILLLEIRTSRHASSVGRASLLVNPMRTILQERTRDLIRPRVLAVHSKFFEGSRVRILVGLIVQAWMLVTTKGDWEILELQTNLIQDRLVRRDEKHASIGL